MTLFAEPAVRALTLCGHDLPKYAHVCAFFDSAEQEDDCVVPFFAEGLAQGEQLVSIRAADHATRHINKLRGMMPGAMDSAVQNDQLQVLQPDETYLKDGHFSSDAMYELVENFLKEGRGKRGGVRACGDMSWALRDMPGTSELMEYESRLNNLTAQHNCALLCVYDVNKFSGRAVMDVLATHPMVVMGDRVYENPYYVEPHQFLKTLVRRGSAPLAREVA